MQSHVLSAWEPFQTIWLKIVWIYGSSVSWQIEAENGPCSLGPSLYFGIRPFSRRGEIAAREGHLGTCLISAQSVFNESKIVRFCRLSRGAKMERTRFLVRKQTLRPETSAHSWQSRVRDALFSTLFLNGRTIKKLTASFPARGAGGGRNAPPHAAPVFFVNVRITEAAISEGINIFFEWVSIPKVGKYPYVTVVVRCPFFCGIPGFK